MFIRIVKLSIAPERLPEFLETFDQSKEKIRNFPGNTFLELYQDKANPSIVFTYSLWEDEQDLENYRHSDVFRGIWSVIKPMFNAAPEAWSVDKLISLP
ncbi:putative quinol monooxygenase [Capnocytophaga sp. ARDL2]|uniref:putative quinol monooxygenase n=1 Tax=Capnocytophaga sp. ARDL2 TaxID=3238809 RepID=UPI003556B209